ncbi:hypothetical protein GH733_002556, partial [Mirounga leonina]
MIRVVLPTFILEKRSLLEMYADFMAHPDLLLAVTAGATPEERVICFVEYYLTAFHEGRKGALAKKPYNPIIGETFHCSWEVPKDSVKPKRTAPHSPAGHEHPMAEDPSKSYKLRFVAEQVSHHPPISCFYCECKEKRLCVNTHVWTKSKFMGMSVGVSMIGEGVLKLLEHGEEYVFTLPSAYARSILTIPWVELGGKVSISCAKTGYSATVIFHTKPFYGGKVHRVTAEVKHNPTNTIVCKAHGEWNGTLEFTYNSGETRVIDTTTLPVYPKKIRPLEKQGPMESRNLWQEVTRYLRLGNIDAATEQKRRLEEKQRVEERKRENLHTPWQPKYFIQEVTLPPAFGDLSQARGAWVCLANAAVWMDEDGGREVLGSNKLAVKHLEWTKGDGHARKGQHESWVLSTSAVTRESDTGRVIATRLPTPWAIGQGTLGPVEVVCGAVGKLSENRIRNNESVAATVLNADPQEPGSINERRT